MWLTHLRFTLHTFWWRAMGWYGPPMAPGERPFRSFPTRCVLCGRLENPFSETFIAVWGNVVEKVMAHTYVWYCDQLGIERPTGCLNPHHRSVCHRHKSLWRDSLTDCLTGVQHSLSSQPRPIIQRWSNRIHEARYWIQVAARFAWSVAG